MPGTLKLLKTLCRQAPVMAFMALATSGLATDARAGTIIVEDEITLTVNSAQVKAMKTRQGATVKIRLPGPASLDKKGTRFSLVGAGGGIQCEGGINGSTKFIDRELFVIDGDGTAYNRFIEFIHPDDEHTVEKLRPFDRKFNYNSDNKKFEFDVTLCGRVIGSQFKILWSSTAHPTPFAGSSTTIVKVVSDDTPPTVANAIPDQTATVGTAFSYAFPANTFSDANGDSLTYTATKSDGSVLPSWLNFTPGTRTFSGTPQAGDVGTVSVKVTADDGNSGTVSDTFDIVVSNAAPTTPTITIAGGSAVTEGTAAIFTLTASPAPTANLTINLTVSESDDFVAGNDKGTKTVTIGTSGTATYTVPTVNDNTDEANGSVKVTVNTGSGYTVGNPDWAKVTVNDDDLAATATLSLSGPATIADEGDSGTRDLVYTVSLSQAPSAKVYWKVCFAGTATADTDGGAINTNADYQLRTQREGTVEGTCTKNYMFISGLRLNSANAIKIRVKGDTVVEQDETVTATLSIVGTPPSDITLGTSTHTHTIRNDDAGGADTTAPRVSSITRQSPTTSPTDADHLTWRVTFNEAVQNVDETDFQVSGTTATLSVSEVSSFVYDVTVSGGNLADLNGTVTLSFASGHNIQDTSGNSLVASPEPTGANEISFVVQNTSPTTPTLVLSKNTLSVAEGGTGNYTVKLATEPTGTVTVSIASNNSDVTVSPASLTFHASGAGKPWNTAQTVTVSAGQDGDAANESAALTHTAAGGGYGSVTGSVTVTVNDDDSPPPAQPAASFASASSSTAEDAGTHSVTVNLSTGAPADGLTLGYSVSGTATAGNGNDFTIQNSGTVTIAAGAASATIPVAINDDSTNENDETVTLTLTGGTGYTLGNPKAHTLTITDNDETASPLSSPSQPVITISGGNAVTEGTAASFTLTASPAPSADLDVSVDVTQSGSFVANGDRGTKTVTIPSGQTLKTFTVPTQGDSTDEPDGSVTSTLATGTGYSVGSTSSASVAVNDDDATPSSSLSSPSQPVITISGGNAVTEGTAASFTLTASPVPGTSLVVNLNVSEETGGGQDYVAASDEGGKTVTISANAGTATFTVGTIADSTDEPNGRVMVAVNSGTGYSVGSTSSASVAVNDDDATPSSSTSSFGDDRSLSIDDAAAMEKDGVISFTVRLSAATVGNSQATVRVATRDVTAVSGLDYRSVDTRLVFRAGETTKVVTVGLINDAHNEGAETFEVVLSNPSNAIIGDGVATGTINNADYVPRSELAHFGRSVANQVLEGVIGRIRSPRAPGVSARIAGNAVPSGRAPGPNCTVCNTLSTDKRVEKFDREEVLTNSSFVLNGQDAPGRSPAFWGRGTRSDFTDRPGGLSLDGGVTSFMLGTDLGWNDGRLLGLALIRSSGEIDHMEWAGGGDRNTGRTELTLTALVPYAGWKINERVDAWGALGHGSGEMHLGLNAGERAEEISAGFDWTMAAGGLRGALAGFDDGPRLTAVLDGWRVKTSSKETEGLAATRSSMTRLRAGLEAGWEMQLEDGAVLAPRLETNLIRESGDTGSSFGLELVGGLSWTDPGLGLAIDMSARRLRSDESSGRKDHGYSMALVYDPDPDSGRGLSLSMRQETGNPGSTMDDFLTSSLPGGADEGGTHWTTELAYGLPAVGGSFTGSPHAGIEETDDYRDYKLGWRLTPAGPQAPDISFDINASRREQTMSSSADHRLGIGLVAEW